MIQPGSALSINALGLGFFAVIASRGELQSGSYTSSAYNLTIIKVRIIIILRILLKSFKESFVSSTLFATNILPLARFKASASEVLNGMKRDGRPVIITQNGEAAAVLLRPEEYDHLAYRSSFLSAIEKGYKDSEEGRTVGQAELAAELTIPRGGSGETSGVPAGLLQRGGAVSESASQHQ